MSNVTSVTDSLGRMLDIKKLGTADQFDLLEAAQDRADYTQWFGLASLVFSCVGIDGVPLPMPRKPDDFKKNAMVMKNEGIKAVADYFASQIDEKTSISDVESAKN